MTDREESLHWRLRSRIADIQRAHPDVPRFKLRNKTGLRFQNICYMIMAFRYPTSLVLLLEMLDTILIRADSHRDDDWWGELDLALFLLSPYRDGGGHMERNVIVEGRPCPTCDVLREPEDIEMVLEWLAIVKSWPVVDTVVCGPPESAMAYWSEILKQSQR